MFNKVKTSELKVTGMSCHHCEMTVEKALKDLSNIKSVKASAPESKVTIEYISDLDLNKITDKIKSVGYEVIEN